MTLPAFLLGLLIAALYGVVFHLLRGGSLLRLFLYILLALIGFWGGHFLAGALGLTFASLGPLHLGMATVGSLIFLLLGYWLSLVEVGPQPKK